VKISCSPTASEVRAFWLSAAVAIIVAESEGRAFWEYTTTGIDAEMRLSNAEIR